MLVRSYRTVSPLPPYPKLQAWAAVCFLWHCPASHLGLPLAITLLCEVRTFLDSHGAAAAQPTRSPEQTSSFPPQLDHIVDQVALLAVGADRISLRRPEPHRLPLRVVERQAGKYLLGGREFVVVHLF